jgi:hypothetical protein
MRELYVRILVMASKKLRVGFDFDGVIAYNPLRLLRSPYAAFQRRVLGKKGVHFIYPEGNLQRAIWNLAHEISFFPSAGFDDLKKLLREKKIEGYLVTGRYSFLEDSLHKWLKKYGAEDLFKEIHINKKDEQPHLFKERMIKKLDLDMFVEDNWDIVQHLNHTKHSPSLAVHWVYNIVDIFKKYERKHPHLRSFLGAIKNAQRSHGHK